MNPKQNAVEEPAGESMPALSARRWARKAGAAKILAAVAAVSMPGDVRAALTEVFDERRAKRNLERATAAGAARRIARAKAKRLRKGARRG